MTAERRFAKIAFVGFLLFVFVAYSYLSLDLRWASNGGNIGAGFFPRLIGFSGVAIVGWLLLAEVRQVWVDRRRRQADEGTDDTAPVASVVDFAAAIVGCIALIALLRWTGLYVSTAVFLVSAQVYLRRRATWPMLLIALVAPILLFLLMVKLLGIQMPLGLLAWFQ